MTKKKFISDYTERFGFYMLEGESDGSAVEKMLGEVYDKMKRPTEKKFYDWAGKRFVELTKEGERPDLSFPISLLLIELYKKYLSDENGGDETSTVSEDHICTQYQKDTFCKECGLFVSGSFYDLPKEKQEAMRSPSEEDILSLAKKYPGSKK